MTEDSSSSAVNFADTPLTKLAKFVGIELKYVNAARKAVPIAPEVVRAVLAAMNPQVLNDIDALTELSQWLVTRRRLPPLTRGRRVDLSGIGLWAGYASRRSFAIGDRQHPQRLGPHSHYGPSAPPK